MALTNEQKLLITTRVTALLYDLPDGSAGLVSQLIDDAAAWAEAFTCRSSILDGMMTSVGDLAVWMYNRMGTEGESSRSEGGESYSFEEAPRRIYDILKLYRLARVGGKAHETAETD